MTTEEKIKANDEFRDIISHAIAGSDENISEADFNLAINGCVKFLSSEIREAQIKILEGLRDKTQTAIDILTNEPFFKLRLRPLNPTRVNALEWQIDQFNSQIFELREEGKEKGKV